MSELRALRERVEKATGEDDEELLIIRALVEALDLSTTDAGNIRLFASAGAYLSAAVLLVEGAMPGAFWSVTNAAIKPRAIVFMPSPTSRGQAPQKHRSAPTPTLALIAALLSALESTNG